MTAASTDRLRSGDVFDERFVIRKHLGAGNFSDVYWAEQHVCNVYLRNVALKVFRQEVNASNAREVFAEAILICRLVEECPSVDVDRHIVHILDGGTSKSHGGRAYLTMEFIQGQELSSAIRRYAGLPDLGGLPLDLSLVWMSQILVPLAWMHTLQTPAVHGDLHPGNLLITAADEIKVVDFGLAARLPGLVLGGAIDYQAPETLLAQLGGMQSDVSGTRFDVYALGLIWYEMLTARRPFKSEKMDDLSIQLGAVSAEVRGLEKNGASAALARKKESWRNIQVQYTQEHLRLRRQGPNEPASHINKQLAEHPRLEAILNKCLEYDPSRRYPNAADLSRALSGYSQGTFEPMPAAANIPSPKLPERTPEFLVRQAEGRIAEGDFDRARRDADEAIGKRPNWHKPWLVKARAALGASRCEGRDRQACMEEATNCADKASSMARNDPEVLDLLAEVYRCKGKAALAKDLSDQAAKIRSMKGRNK